MSTDIIKRNPGQHGPQKQYDDARLIQLFADGKHTHLEISEIIGLSRGQVSNIALRASRPEIMKAVDKLLQIKSQRIKKFALSHIFNAIKRLVVLSEDKKNKEVARKACNDIIRIGVGDDGKALLEVNTEGQQVTVKYIHGVDNDDI